MGVSRFRGRRLARVAALLLLQLFSGCGAEEAGPRAYVSNERDATVTAIDTRADRVVDRIEVGARPRGIRVSPDGARVYVALSYSSQQAPGTINKIAAVDTASGEVAAKYDAGSDPEQFAVFAAVMYFARFASVAFVLSTTTRCPVPRQASRSVLPGCRVLNRSRLRRTCVSKKRPW